MNREIKLNHLIFTAAFLLTSSLSAANVMDSDDTPPARQFIDERFIFDTEYRLSCNQQHTKTQGKSLNKTLEYLMTDNDN